VARVALMLNKNFNTKYYHESEGWVQEVLTPFLITPTTIGTLFSPLFIPITPESCPNHSVLP